MSRPRIERFEPGPCERSPSARLHYKLCGRWPQSVVAERLADMDRRSVAARLEMDRWLKDMYRTTNEESPDE